MPNARVDILHCLQHAMKTVLTKKQQLYLETLTKKGLFENREKTSQSKHILKPGVNNFFQKMRFSIMIYDEAVS